MLLCKGDGLDYLFCAGTRKSEIDEIGGFELQVAAWRGSISGSGACRDSQLLAYIQIQVMADRFTQQKLHVWPMHLPTQVMESKAAAVTVMRGDKATAWASSAFRR
jgi:hypothetical protein